MQEEIRKIADHFGKEIQMSKCIEELAELTQAISKIQIEGMNASRYSNLVEEIEDVKIMIEQLEYLFKIPRESGEHFREFKIKRTMERCGIDE